MLALRTQMFINYRNLAFCKKKQQQQQQKTDQNLELLTTSKIRINKHLSCYG